MMQKSQFDKKIFYPMFLSLVFIFLFGMVFTSHCYAGAYIVGTSSQDYLNAPAVGSNVVGYLIADYISPQLTRMHLFVKKCECLKRIDYKYEGVLVNFVRTLTKEEFDGLTPEVLVGMIDTEGQLSSELGNEHGLIAVIERVLEYKKTKNQFAARVSLKFVYLNP